MSKWINVEDMLPDRGVRVLAWGNGWYSVGDCFHGTQENHHHYCHKDGECKEVAWRWHEDGTTVRHANVTHWMPLPDPPTPNE